MVISKRSHSKIALLTVAGLISTAVLPILRSVPATAMTPQAYTVAQLFPTSRIAIPDGTVIPVRYDEAEKIIVTPDETAEISLTVASDVRSNSGTVLIPAGSVIEGELQPMDDGTRFISDEIVFSNERRLPIDATSAPITDTEIITEESDPDILRGAAIGAAAAAVLFEVLGDIDIIEVLGGAGLGALGALLLGGDKEEVEVLVIEPETDLDLTLQSDFEL
ncbi:MAG TPA: hypothetical protein ACFE0H_05030 [Elainellaceae cyanobacterium]